MADSGLQDSEGLLARLVATKVRFVVVGGLASSTYGGTDPGRPV